MPELSIEPVQEAGDDLVEAFARLLPQLSAGAAPLDSPALRRLLAEPGVTLLVARVDGRILGTLTLVRYRLPTGLRFRIEDVVVDGSARGQGLGRALTEEALRRARQAGARTVDLTSRPSRTTANRLYERLGFVRRDSVVYRLDPEPKG